MINKQTTTELLSPKASADDTHQRQPEPTKRIQMCEMSPYMERNLDERTQQAIQTTLLNLELKDRTPQTIASVKKHLVQIAHNSDIFNSKQVLEYILHMKRDEQHAQRQKQDTAKPLTKGYIKRFIDDYKTFCDSNQTPFDKPRVKPELPIPIIPSTEQVHDIINMGEPDSIAIFTIFAETAIEQEELHRTPITQVDREQGKISLNGLKGHANGIYTLKPRTADMLRIYLSKRIGQQYPFPKPKTISENWRNARKRASKSLCKPELKNIQLKNLRNYAGSIFYKTHHHEPIATMRFMRHKKLETTLHYIRAINLDEPEEYTTTAIQLGTPDTQKQIIELSDAGYEKLTEADGYQYFRIHKT